MPVNKWPYFQKGCLPGWAFKWGPYTADYRKQPNTYRPGTQQANQQVATEASRQHLGDHVQIGYQGRLKNDGNIGSIEQLDGVSVVLATVAGRLDGEVHSEALK